MARTRRTQAHERFRHQAGQPTCSHTSAQSGSLRQGSTYRHGGLRGLRAHAASLGARERSIAATATRWAREARAGHDLVADLARGRHVDRAREALEEVGDEGGGSPRLANELDRKLTVVQGGERAEKGESLGVQPAGYLNQEEDGGVALGDGRLVVALLGRLLAGEVLSNCPRRVLARAGILGRSGYCSVASSLPGA